ncbi:PH domain-containing protein [Streptomyces zhihengii]|uniref:PH domain-containing protein n=1 Tax=Streptomyces zhihengii TaxID=1818004 RepID=UPI0033AE818A
MTSSEPPAEPTYADRVFRSPAAMAGGGLLLAIIGWIVVDAAVRGEGRAPWVALAVALFAVPLIVAFTFRPAVHVNDERLRIRNPFRTVTVPWGAVADVRASYSSELVTQSGTKYQLWAIPVSLRQRKRAARRQMQRAADDPHGRTSVTADVSDDESRMAPADRTIAELRATAERLGSRPETQGEPTTRWAFELLAPLGAGAVLALVLLAL